MYKSSFIFQKIENMSSFQQFLANQVISNLSKISQVSRVQITSVGPSVDPTPQNLTPIQSILEIYFSSVKDMYELIESTNGAKIVDLIVNNPFSETATFLGNETVYRTK